MTHPLLVTLVAEGPTNTGPDAGKASPIGLLIVVLLLIAVFALVRSMNRHLKKVPESFDMAEDAAMRDSPGPEGEPKGDSGR